jgi:F0F1-type ATP synthase membrane subunit c/vacuolar-type H+-ATPase subunit K
MSGIIAVYALVVAVLIAGNMKPPPEMQYSLFNGFMHLACGLSVGLTGLAAGYAIGIVGDSVREARIGREGMLTDTYNLLTLHRVYAHTCSSHVSSSAWFLS